MSETLTPVKPGIRDHFAAASSGGSEAIFWAMVLTIFDGVLRTHGMTSTAAHLITAIPAAVAVSDVISNYRDALIGHAARSAGGNSGNLYIAKPDGPK